MSFERTRTTVAIIAASTSLAAFTAPEVLASPQDAHDDICNTVTGGKGNPVVDTYDPTVLLQYDTALDDPALDDSYNTYRECGTATFTDQLCADMGGVAQRTVIDDFKTKTSYTNYTCEGKDVGLYPVDPGDDTPVTLPPQSTPDDFYPSLGDYPELDNIKGGLVEDNSSYSAPLKPSFIRSCVRKALSSPRAHVRAIKDGSGDLLVEQSPPIVAPGCEEAIGVEVDAKPMLGNSKGVLRSNGTTQVLDNDSDRVLNTNREYTCLGTRNDDKVRRFGARITKTVRIYDQDGNVVKVEKRRFTVTAPKYVLSNAGKR